MHPWLGLQRLNRFGGGGCQGNSGGTVFHGVSSSGWWGKMRSVLVAVARSSPSVVQRRPSVKISREPAFTTAPSARRAPFRSVTGRKYFTVIRDAIGGGAMLPLRRPEK